MRRMETGFKARLVGTYCIIFKIFKYVETLIQGGKFTLKNLIKERSFWIHEENGLGKRIDVEGQFRSRRSNPWRENDSRVVAMETEGSG